MHTKTTTHAFQADVGQLLKLVIHSLYSHQEIFLRELISNASDALDKLRFRAVTDSGILGEDPTLEIRISADKEQGILRIEDTGIGMTEAEVVENLGTVAHSGSRAFLERIAQQGGEKADLALIGQFGVGFYSAYLVAERVEVVTRSAERDAQAVRWSSDANETFTVEPAERASRGTEVILHFREDQRSLLEDWRLRELCKRYSDYVSHPIKLEVKRKDERKLETINHASALWRRPKAEIPETDYNELYKHITHDLGQPLGRAHFRVEGRQEFYVLLYVPRRPPYDLNDGKKRRGVRLFVRRVFVMDDCEEILPSWLRFLRGVVDSDDLPLNVSRELLQDSAVVKVIKNQIIGRTLDLLDEMAKDRPEDYAEFWRNYGAVLKESLAFENEHKDRIAALVRYESTRGEGLTSLAEYAARAPEKQEAIYYIFGASQAAVADSPYLEGLRAGGYEVLLMTDPVDEWAAKGIGEFQGKPLKSAMLADLSLPDAKDGGEEAKEGDGAGTLEPLLERIQQVLASKVREVKVSSRLTDSPACLVLASGETPAFMDQLLKSSGRGLPQGRRILEINATHPAIKNLERMLGVEADRKRVDDWIEVLYNQALLSEGRSIEDPNRFAKLLGTLFTEATSQRAGA